MIFERMAERPLNAVAIRSGFCKENPFKEASTWVMEGRVFEVMDDYACMARSLPKAYESVKHAYMRPVMDTYLGADTLWLWRAKGHLNFARAVQYRKLFRMYRRKSLRHVFLISICPPKIAELVCSVNGSKIGLYR